MKIRARTTDCNLNAGSSVKPNYELEFEITPRELLEQITHKEVGEILDEINLPKPISEGNGKYVHYGIMVENGKTIKLYQDGKKVNDIDFWNFDQRQTNKIPKDGWKQEEG